MPAPARGHGGFPDPRKDVEGLRSQSIHVVHNPMLRSGHTPVHPLSSTGSTFVSRVWPFRTAKMRP